MTVRWVVLLVLGGCFSPTVPQDVPCDITAPVCPDGQQCRSVAGGFACGVGPTVDDARIVIDTPRAHDAKPDLDGDGVPDEFDNCPTIPNTKQYDEDHDNIGDVCDKCPTVDDSADPDGDHDGVGDACDPNPTTPGDQLYFFDGLHDLDNWATYGNWSASFGSAKADAADGNHATLRHSAAPTTGTVYISASYKITAFHETTGYGGAGVVDLHGPTSDNAIECASIESQPGAAQTVAVVDTSTESIQTSTAMPVIVGDTYIVTQKRVTKPANAYSFDCAALHGVATVTAHADVTNTTANPELGFRVHSASVQVNWFMVITSP